MKELTDSSYRVYLTPDSQGAALARVEWQLSTRDISFRSYITDARMRSRELEPLRFSTDAERLRELATAMLACARELDAIEAYTKPTPSSERMTDCFGYLETITLADAESCSRESSDPSSVAGMNALALQPLGELTPVLGESLDLGDKPARRRLKRTWLSALALAACLDTASAAAVMHSR